MALSNLPTELIEHITLYLDRPTSCSLRLTSPSLSKKTSHVFKDRFFRQHTLQWTREAFSRLQEMTSHPHFGNSLQHLVIEATPRHSIHLWQTQTHISNTQGISTPYGVVSATRDLEEKYATDSKVADDIATFFSETRFDRKCLVTLFEGLEQLESITFAYEGMDDRYAKFATRYCKISQHEMSRPFVSTMSAIATSKIQVRSIRLDNAKTYGAVGIGRLENIAPLLRDFDHAFEKLETLQLHLRDLRSSHSGFELEAPRTPFVVRFLAKARNVRRLELSCYSSLDGDVFGELARHCRFGKLETCKLSTVRIQAAEDLFTLLQPSEKTLTALHLVNVRLSDEVTMWRDLLGNVAASEDILPNLEDFSLGNLFTLDRFNIWLKGRKGLCCVGEDWRGQLSNAVDEIEERPAELPWGMAAVVYPFVGFSV
ncbi:hypothetical protein G6011_07756 [Alternaria panax]|uniref:F-box domain-containing protein n=1 Tax=Alternaria panax TaxID=48097 RepID=A0AAD4F809_9PLEO|nr:hypothetical protein G6011_07756 [Alternaria panax]